MAAVYIAIIVAASMLWMMLLMKLDRFRLDKGHSHIIAAGFLTGCMSVFPTLWLYSWHPLERFFQNGNPLEDLLVVGPVEETAKFLMFVILVTARRSIKEPQDGMIQGAAVGLGFSAVENYFYATEYGLEVLLLRSVLTMLAHMVYAAVWGFSYGAATYAVLDKNNRTSFGFVAAAFFPAAMVHGLSNAVMDFGGGFAAASLVDLIALALAFKGFKLLLGSSPYFPFPYAEAGRAICAIRLGLIRNPGSHLLHRRLGLYCLAGGRYRDAERIFRACAERSARPAAYRLLQGAALMGSGQSAQGAKLISEAGVLLGLKPKEAMQSELKRIIRSRPLYGRVLDALSRRNTPSVSPASRFVRARGRPIISLKSCPSRLSRTIF